jgi:hypothetical protein
MEEFQLNITIEEGKKIFLALSEMPFKRVYDLIGRINSQTVQQDKRPDHLKQDITFILSGPDIDLIAESLSAFPYNQVHTTMQKIQTLKHAGTIYKNN